MSIMREANMTVYELLIDSEMTTRSRTQSWGLFSSREKAE